jgi:hypothetical protein
MGSGAPAWRPVRAALVLLSTAALASAAALACASTQGAPRWDRALLPPSIRDRVHFVARDVPAFPMDDRRLLQPKSWPETMTIGGVACALRIHAWDDDDAVAAASLADVEENSRVMLFYDTASSRWNAANAGWGPRYLWNEKGKLIQRLFYEPDSSRLVTHDYTYYKDGQLLGYSRRAERRRPMRLSGSPYEYLSEFFSKDGRLIAVAHENMSDRSRDSVYAWMGAMIPYDEFRMKTHVLYSSAHPGSR